MDYRRSFIILNKEDQSYCENGATGYCKIESKGDKSTVKIFIQGLKSLEKGKTYKIYLLRYNDDEFIPAYLGEFEFIKGNREFDIEVNTQNILSTGYNILEFNIVAVCMRDMNICEVPLVGYYNSKKLNGWKDKLIRYLLHNSDMLKIECQVRLNERREKISENNILQLKKSGEDFNQQMTSEFVDCDNYHRYLKESNFEKIKEIMDNTRGIIETNPFSQTKLKYKWWKISNLKFLESIHKFSIISDQIFKHPLVKKKLREANYCLYGIVSDVNNKIKYIAFGFPSKYSTKDQIYLGGFSVFYPALGFNKRNGDFGYWVVHIRIDSQNIAITV